MILPTNTSHSDRHQVLTEIADSDIKDAQHGVVRPPTAFAGSCAGWSSDRFARWVGLQMHNTLRVTQAANTSHWVKVDMQDVKSDFNELVTKLKLQGHPLVEKLGKSIANVLSNVEHNLREIFAVQTNVRSLLMQFFRQFGERDIDKEEPVKAS